MIVDCHTHIWESTEQLGLSAALWEPRPRGRTAQAPPRASTADHLTAAKPVDFSIVLAFKSHHLSADVPNDYVADYVRQHGDKIIGFASVDPTRPREAIDELHKAHEQLGLKGLTVWPAAQNFHPTCTPAMRVYQEAARLRIPIMFHQNATASPQTRMEFARPYLIDEVAREFPDLRIIVAQLGYPWIEEAVVLLAKHRNVFADISGLLLHPWQSYQALLSAYQGGVMDALLFGSNFPFTLPATCIESLYSINQVCHGTNLPTIPREQLRQIVERNALEALGIETRVKIRERDTTVLTADDEEGR